MAGCGAFGAFVIRVCADADFRAALGFLSLAFHSWPNFSGLSMGRASFGDRLSCDLFGSLGIEPTFCAEIGILANHSVAAMVAVIPPDALVGNGQIEQR